MLRSTTQRMRMLALVLLFVSCLCGVYAEYRMICSNSSRTNTTLKPSDDGVKGRYTVEWCTDISPKDTIWSIEIAYNRKNHSNCLHRNKHSDKTVYLDNLNVNCSHVCLYTNMDLIFSTCYTIGNWFPTRGSMRAITKHSISNEFTVDSFSNNNFRGNTINHGDYVSAHWYLGSVPATDYDMELCKNTTISPHHWDWDCQIINGNCSTSLSSPQHSEIVCKLWQLRGDYDLRLSLTAPWVGGDFMHQKKNAHMIFRAERACPRAAAAAAVAAWWWALAAAGAAAAAAALLALVLRWRRARAFRKQVLREWLHREESKPAAPVTAAPGSVLLMYAREGPVGAGVVDALKRLLDEALPGQVFDICSVETLALAAPSGGEWVRSMVQSPGVRVLLLQTPALHALHAPHFVTEAGQPRLQQPLLPRRAVYRRPAAADWLLRPALQLVAGAAHLDSPAPYKKFYLATLEGLETEALPYTVPFRRYLLPAHARTLVADLAPAAAGPAPPAPPGAPAPPAPGAPAPRAPAPRQLEDELARAVTDFVDHARAHPDYLTDELLFIND